MIEKNEKSGELMEVKEQAKTVRKYPERMIVRIWLVLALICLLAGLISQYTFRLKEPLFLHYSQSAYLGCGLDGVETSEMESFHLCQVRRLKKKENLPQ